MERSESDQIIADLLEWAGQFGGLEAQVWTRAKAHMDKVRAIESMETPRQDGIKAMVAWLAGSGITQDAAQDAMAQHFNKDFPDADDWLEQAKWEYEGHRDGQDIQIDSNAMFSPDDSGFVWVQSWALIELKQDEPGPDTSEGEE